jgi:hypothetical protein
VGLGKPQLVGGTVQHMVVMRRDPNPEKQAIDLDLTVLPSGATPEALDVIGTKVFRVSSLLFTVTSTKLSPSPNKSGLKLVCNVNVVYGNLKSETSQDCAQKPQRL